ncbi:MAG: hypothetical protein ACE5KM_10655 [Planctomycetaceae bacterium]
MPTPIPIRSILAIVCAVLTGCGGGLQKMKLPGIPNAEQLQAAEREEHRQSEKYQTSGDRKAFRWLLANRVRQGMTLDEVNRILGRDGKRVYEDARYKALTEGVRRSDETYQWRGAEKSFILFFRNERLVNHKPSQYADAEPTSFE